MQGHAGNEGGAGQVVDNEDLERRNIGDLNSRSMGEGGISSGTTGRWYVRT